MAIDKDNIDLSSIGNRIRFIRNMLNINQEVFGDILNVTASAICTYESNQRTPRDKTIDKICTKFKVNKEFLLEGKEPIFTKKLEPLDLLILIEQTYDLNSQDRDILYNYLTLDESAKIDIKNYINNLKPKPIKNKKGR